MASFGLLKPTLFIILLLSCSGTNSVLAVSLNAWCVAKPGSSDQMLQDGLEYACNHADCGPLKQQGGSCFNPNTLVQHTSFAMNMFYQSMGRHKWDCNFQGSALLSLTDPSFGSCCYPGGFAEVDTSRTWCVANPATSNELLQSNIDYACQKVDCRPIQSGGACFDPNTLLHHASFAMNLYYQLSAKTVSACDFKNSGLIVANNDPSFGSCTYPSG